MTKDEVQAYILTYFGVCDGVERIEAVTDADNHILASLETYQSQCTLCLRRYCRQTERGRWVMDKVGMPFWVAAALESTISVVDSPTHLHTICGMEARRYISPEEAKAAMATVGIQRADNPVSPDKIVKLSRLVDRNPHKILSAPANFESVLYWATKRKHNEFMRTVCLRLGAWIAQTPNAPYRDVYIEVIGSESQKDIHMAQVEQRARTTAVRHFLAEYFAFRYSENAA